MVLAVKKAATVLAAEKSERMGRSKLLVHLHRGVLEVDNGPGGIWTHDFRIANAAFIPS